MSGLKASHTFPFGQVLEIVQGDITEEKVDAIVNAANSSLLHGGGVAGIISRKGGSQIQEESDAWVRRHGAVRHGEPAYTSAGKLPARYVIHAVGPVWGSGNEEAKLADAIEGSLKLADSLKVSSIAFPAISTGIFGYPKEQAALVFFKSINSYFRQNNDSGLGLVRLTLFDAPTLQAFLKVYDDYVFQE